MRMSIQIWWGNIAAYSNAEGPSGTLRIDATGLPTLVLDRVTRPSPYRLVLNYLQHSQILLVFANNGISMERACLNLDGPGRRDCLLQHTTLSCAYSLASIQSLHSLPYPASNHEISQSTKLSRLDLHLISQPHSTWHDVYFINHSTWTRQNAFVPPCEAF
jgi:hypothetical protein